MSLLNKNSTVNDENAKNDEKIQKEKEYKRCWYARNREILRENHRRYYKENKERIKHYTKKWYQKNKEKQAEYQRQYRARIKKLSEDEKLLLTPEEIAIREMRRKQQRSEYARFWYSENRERILLKYHEKRRLKNETQ